VKKRDDKAFGYRPEGEAKPRAATQVNAISASLTPPTGEPEQLELFPGRASPLKAKSATARNKADQTPRRRDGVQGGSTRRQKTKMTGEVHVGPEGSDAPGREAYKGDRKRRPDAKVEVGGEHSSAEGRENRLELRFATFVELMKQGKIAGLPPRGKAQPRPKTGGHYAPKRKAPERLDPIRKLQRKLYRVAKCEPQRRFTLLYDKVCQASLLREAWRRVKRNGGAAGVDRVTVEAIEQEGVERFLAELREELLARRYRVKSVRRVHIPKAGQPGKTRPLGIPTVKDRVVQMAVKLVIEPLFEADFMPCSYGFRPKRTPRMALNAIVAGVRGGLRHVIDVDLSSYFDTIPHDGLIRLVERRVGDTEILRLIRAWLTAGVMEEGKVRHAERGTPQGGVISPLLANIYLHEVDRQWQELASHSRSAAYGNALRGVRLIRYADDMVLLARSKAVAEEALACLKGQLESFSLQLNAEKSRLTTAQEGFDFLGFSFRMTGRGRLYLWPRAKAVKSIAQKVRDTVRSVSSMARLTDVIVRLNPVLNGWCTYFRAGHSNRVFHKVDWMVRNEVQLWLRRKFNIARYSAARRWNYSVLHHRLKLYRMVGKVSHLEALSA
jgi:RNA-directed DNA polymerase